MNALLFVVGRLQPKVEHALECDSCLRWQHRTGGSGVTVLEYRNWTGDQEYICSVCRDVQLPILQNKFTAYLNIPL
jgi:hypothetical protein